MIVLRDYQLDALDRLRTAIRAGKRRIVLVAPTGSGKTTIAAEMIRSAVDRGNRCLFLAHRKELIDQAHARLATFGVPAGVIMGQDARRQPDWPVQVASVQTLCRRPALDPAPVVIVGDEAHRAVGPTQRKVLDAYPNAVVIGITATPFRLDGRGLGEVFDELVVCSTPDKLVLSGHLVEPTYFAPWSVDTSGFHTVGGDYSEEEQEKPFLAAIPCIVEHYRKLGRGPTLAFCPTIAMSKALVAAIGPEAEHVDGDTPKGEREAILARLRSGVTRVVSNCCVLCEGYDLPACGTVMLCRATKSLCLYLQMVGRGLRPFDGKDTAIVLDFGANFARLKVWPTEDISDEYTLSGRIKRVRDADAVRTCPECFAMWPSAKGWPCPACGYAPPPKVFADDGEDAALREVKRPERLKTDAADAKRHAQFDHWRQVARVAGWKPGYVAKRYLDNYGVWPPWCHHCGRPKRARGQASSPETCAEWARGTCAAAAPVTPTRESIGWL